MAEYVELTLTDSTGDTRPVTVRIYKRNLSHNGVDLHRVARVIARGEVTVDHVRNTTERYDERGESRIY